MTDDTYVMNGAWLTPTGRPDAIDEIADQFERRAPSGAAEFWDDVSARRVLREVSLAPRSFERRAG
jgi:hypothetical protein